MRYGRVLVDNEVETPEKGTVNFRVGFDKSLYFKLDTGEEIRVGGNSAPNEPKTIIDITYNNLYNLYQNSQMQEDTFYRITNHRTITGGFKTDEVLVADAFEPIIVYAVASNTLQKTAYSAVHPTDIIEYDITNNVVSDGSSRTGKITYRKRLDKNIAGKFDVRFAKARRYKVTGYFNNNIADMPDSTYITIGISYWIGYQFRRQNLIKMPFTKAGVDYMIDADGGYYALYNALTNEPFVNFVANTLYHFSIRNDTGSIWVTPTPDENVFLDNVIDKYVCSHTDVITVSGVEQTVGLVAGLAFAVDENDYFDALIFREEADIKNVNLGSTFIADDTGANIFNSDIDGLEVTDSHGLNTIVEGAYVAANKPANFSSNFIVGGFTGNDNASFSGNFVISYAYGIRGSTGNFIGNVLLGMINGSTVTKYWQQNLHIGTIAGGCILSAGVGNILLATFAISVDNIAAWYSVFGLGQFGFEQYNRVNYNNIYRESRYFFPITDKSVILLDAANKFRSLEISAGGAVSSTLIEK